jgi:hypothetical protein
MSDPSAHGDAVDHYVTFDLYFLCHLSLFLEIKDSRVDGRKQLFEMQIIMGNYLEPLFEKVVSLGI